MQNSQHTKIDYSSIYELVPRFKIHDLPRSEEELCICLDLAKICLDEYTIHLKNLHNN